MSDGTLYPSPLQLRPSSSFEGESPREQFARRTRTYSSAKAREAGFEIPRKPVSPRSNSTSSIPSITVLSPTEPLQHLREPGKLIAYLIPFPKPRLEGVKLEDIPDRFLVYTPTPPPLSKPALGEKETQWHKNRRQWQEDIRKVMMSNAKPKNVEELTLVYPPTFPLAPEQIRTEFVDLLNRTREKSRRDAIISSSLFPVAAALDASLLFTFGGLTEVSGVWAYTSIRGTMASKKMVKDLNRGEIQTDDKADEEPHIEGCKSKAKKTGINLRMQQSPNIEILRRYLELACLKKDFNMFPQLNQMAGDVNEAAVLDAIGWRPTRRSGRDLQDEQWQTMAEREDVKRFMKKGAKEWFEFCKAFQKEQLSACNKK
ncbi:hypothetical protein BCR34DRAFT_472772 [Clohesyomyces aquaticus]|uniref:Uncharacterized protein n=1 Tax=Clohesyomyces aquaticus TaxID=1231657 RepID=A0A1Y2A957_9PLEO|nr:hypothetical protein BCR34DRAFT_472772 [Clohesyomyces aquaticus]